MKLTLVYPSYSRIMGSDKFKRFGVYAGLGKIPERPHVGLGYLSQALLDNGLDHDFIDMNIGITYAQFKKEPADTNLTSLALPWLLQVTCGVIN